MTPVEVEVAAEGLYQAEVTGRQVGLISTAHPEAGLDDAYAVQAALIARKRAAGARIVGWKIGLTSRAMQAALGITTPDSGVLLDDMVFDHGGTVPAGRFIQPRVEAEIAFIMGADLSGEPSREAVLAATQAVAPALEILDTRITRVCAVTGRARTAVDTIADNAANAGVVLGVARHDPRAVDLRWVGAVVARDGVVEETGLGAGVLNDPVLSMQWLVARLARYSQGLRAGDIVLSGSFIRPIEAPAGSVFEADYGAFGRVEIRFS